MADEQSLKPVIWVGSSRKDIRAFPEPVQDHMGYALYVAQRGGKHRDTKTLSGFGGAGVVEVVKDFRGNATPRHRDGVRTSARGRKDSQGEEAMKKKGYETGS